MALLLLQEDQVLLPQALPVEEWHTGRDNGHAGGKAAGRLRWLGGSWLERRGAPWLYVGGHAQGALATERWAVVKLLHEDRTLGPL